MNLKNLTLSMLVLSSLALADGLSATLEVPVLPAFGLSAALNYSVEAPTGLVTGGSIITAVSGGNFALGLRLGSKFAQELYGDGQLDVEGYVGAAANALFIPSPLSVGLEASAGLKLKYLLSSSARLYSDLDLVGSFGLATSSFTPFVGGTLGVKIDAFSSDLYLQAALGSYFTGPFGYDLRAAAYAVVSPEVKLGASLGFGNLQYAPNGQASLSTIGATGVSLRLGLQYTGRPNTIGTPGSHLP